MISTDEIRQRLATVQDQQIDDILQSLVDLVRPTANWPDLDIVADACNHLREVLGMEQVDY